MERRVKRMSSILFGIIVPAFVFIISFTTTFLLFKHFSKKQDDQ